MQGIIIILLLVIIGIFIALYIFYTSELKNINTQLKKINETKTNSKILLTSSNKELRKLIIEVNKNIEENQKSEAIYKRLDLGIRQSIANISHDLRTPLTSVMGYIHLIEDENLEKEERSECLDVIKNRTRDLEELITSFYDLSRLEGNEYKFEMTSININNIMCEVLGGFYKELLKSNIKSIVEVDEAPYFILGDNIAIKRVITNLVQNIIKYGEGDVIFSLKRNGDYVVTIFENKAEKIAKEDVEKLFERFFTADRSRTGKSTGLGLAITKELVQQMGHEIKAELIGDRLRITITWKMQKY
ncbi:HAMP domain-containing histidine kinase [Clostridium gasigenes]|uniref:sensor histidine kinase n=1 Tax=Clostridium gasigenes TaxID=94869 RepID=UPI00143825ED|nr:HAMP domain-containing sensor histidine kinase [Clostridium gasigenes]NKF08584.1 HAMP domain-containing histidine kinase [Clostridium gasigenes]QSW19591.1 HAMP domain-containing histidine kinase [Clostridium gasigenes]